jgi:AcrR family transcriptional regulator
MSRLPGSIDQRKKDAVLAAAAGLILAHGASVSLGEIARRSGVSKQTIYNYFGHKPGLFRAVLESPAGRTECPPCIGPTNVASAVFLSAYAKSLLEWLAHARLVASLRSLISSERSASVHAGTKVADAIAAQALPALARVLAVEARRGRMRIDDPTQAAELFLDLVTAGRALGAAQGVFGAGATDEIETAADACGRIFARAYAADLEELDEDVIASPAGLAAGRAPIGHSTHLRKEASP